MANPSKAEIDYIKNSLKDIEILYQKLKGINPFQGMKAKTIAESSSEVERLKDALDNARDAVSDIEGGSGDLFKSWKAIADEVKDYRFNINAAKGTVSKINDLSEKLKDHHNRTNVLSSKDLYSIKSKLELQKSTLVENSKSLEKNISELKQKKLSNSLNAAGLSQLITAENIYNNITQGLNENNGLLKRITDEAQKEANTREEIEKSLGITGGLLKGISKIPFLKDIINTEKILKAANDEIENSKSGVKGLKAGFKEMKSQVIEGLTNPANIALFTITQMGKALLSSDKATGVLAKGMNITYSEASNVRQELNQIAALSGDVALNTRGLQESLVAVNSALGTNGMLAKDDLITFTKLREQAGMTNEEILGMQKYSMAVGGSLEDNVASFQASAKAASFQNGVAINTKALMADMANVSNRTKLSIEGGAAGLAKAAISAKLMGGNLEKVASAADQLLQFESSIENELSAELLIGKDLTLEKARQAALNNDMATVAEEITRQAGSAADFGNRNRIQQEAMAKAVGMSADGLADMLVEQEALKSVGHALNDQEKEAFEAAKSKYGAEKAAQMLKEGQLDSMVQQQSVQERLNQSMEKMQEVLVGIADPILAIVSPLMNLVSTVLPAINFLLSPLIEGFSLIGKLVGGFINGLKEGNPIIVAITAALVAMKAQTIMTAIFSIFDSLAKIPFGLGLPLAGVAVAGMISLAHSSSKKGNDIMSPGESGGGYGKRTLMGPEGTIQLNDKDTVIAGTNLFDKADDMVQKPQGAISVSNKTSPKKEKQQDPNTGINARLDALISATGRVNSISTLKIQ